MRECPAGTGWGLLWGLLGNQLSCMSALLIETTTQALHSTQVFVCLLSLMVVPVCSRLSHTHTHLTHTSVTHTQTRTQDVFEIGRRYKIMNPEKMRSEFGKLMYMLMDSADSHVQVGQGCG